MYPSIQKEGFFSLKARKIFFNNFNQFIILEWQNDCIISLGAYCLKKPHDIVIL